MEPSLLSIQSLVSEVKNVIFASDVDALVSPSAYDTAWLAMVPSHNQNGPMFAACLKWILENQKEEGGFWGETDEDGLPTIDALPATLASIIALKIWNAGHPNIQSGLSFIHEKAAEILVKTKCESLPRWFILTFAGMIELAEEANIGLVLPHPLKPLIAKIFLNRQHILHMEERVGEEESENYFAVPPLLSYLEALPASWYCKFDGQKMVNKSISSDGSLFQSPSATAQAFISTRNIYSLKYLQSLVLKFPNGGVPAKYPVDGDLIKMCIVDHVQGLGLAEYFDQEIQEILAQVYRNQKNEAIVTNTTTVPVKLFKEALAFRLLRMNGQRVSPGGLCWFLKDPKVVSYMEENYCSPELMSAMYSIYRATDLVFPGESELEEARTFAVNMLLHINSSNITKGLQNMIKYEISVPWCARLDRLYHRKWIEENKMSPLPLWVGKASFYRMSCLDNKELMQLAVQNFEFQQSIYIQELEQLKGWSDKWGIREMGFGREKTLYIYFAVASCSCSGLAHDSVMRILIAKAAIIVTVADDFYDTEASLHELEILTDAVKRWDGEGLKGHSKTIFDALDDFVNHIAAISQSQQPRTALVQNLQEIWKETFLSWMVERKWSLTGYIPSMEEYLATGFISVAAHTMTLSVTTFFEPRNITKLLMAIARFTNDIQTYQREEADGKMNLVLLHLHEHPNLSIQDSISYVKQMLDVKTREFLEHVFMDDEDDDMARSCKKIHLCCMKVFHMFYNSANLFDSDTALLDDIHKSIYLPIRHTKPKPDPNFFNPVESNKKSTRFNPILKRRRDINITTSFVKQPYINNSKLHVHMKFNSRFIGLHM